MDTSDRPPRPELHLHLDADTTFATALAAAGVTAGGHVGTVEVWVAPDAARGTVRP
jgi:hypothetical protein